MGKLNAILDSYANQDGKMQLPPVPPPLVVANETFVLRVYDSGSQTNYPVAPLVCRSHGHHIIDLTTLPATFGGAIYQIYPGRPDHCMYDPIPPQMHWYLITNNGQQLVCIDSHDQYAYFKIPPQTTQLHWVLGTHFEQVKTALFPAPK